MSVRKTPANEAIETLVLFRRASNAYEKATAESLANDLSILRKYARKLFRLLVGRKPTLQELEAMTGLAHLVGTK